MTATWDQLKEAAPFPASTRRYTAVGTWLLDGALLAYLLLTGAPGMTSLGVLGFGLLALAVPGALLYVSQLRALGNRRDLVPRAWAASAFGFIFWRTAEFWFFVGPPTSGPGKSEFWATVTGVVLLGTILAVSLLA